MSSPTAATAPAHLTAWRPWYAWLLWLHLGAVVAIATLAWAGALAVGQLGELDKALHLVLVGGVAFWLDLWLRGRRVAGLSLAVLLVLVVGIADESAQAWSAVRTFDWLDLAANCAGAVAGGWLAGALRARAGRDRHNDARPD